MSETKKVETKASKKTRAAKESKAKAEKGTNVARAPKDPEATKVFAFRLTPAESEALHVAAGPANASRVMRALAGAFVKEDRAVFESIVADARKLRA